MNIILAFRVAAVNSTLQFYYTKKGHNLLITNHLTWKGRRMRLLSLWLLAPVVRWSLFVFCCNTNSASLRRVMVRTVPVLYDIVVFEFWFVVIIYAHPISLAVAKSRKCSHRLTRNNIPSAIL